MKNVDLDSLLTRILTSGLDVVLDGENILSIIRELQEARNKINELEGKEYNKPLTSPLNPWFPPPTDVEPTTPWPKEIPLPTTIIDKCKECNIDLYQLMGYCCPHSNCPCGMGPIISRNEY